MVGAIGVVFGDIGTSPLYAMQTVFAIDDHAVKPNATDVYGVVSLVFWSLMLIVSLKYVTLVMRADNEGEGGILALAHLTRDALRPGSRRFRLVMVLGVLGASLFYGDSVITPAISVLSALEGVKVADPGFENLVLPMGVVIIAGLFAVQRFGTELVGRLFGPIMVVWFIVLGVLGLPHVIADPSVLRALLPTYAVLFVIEHPFIAFVAMGAVVLSITGAEALYADMGHFGRPPIRRAWFWMVLPCLVLNYVGQAQQILKEPASIDSPFFRLAPSWAAIPLVVLATLATIIASQAVISGAFSVSRQAERLGYLPRLTVRYTSRRTHGQIYVPAINWTLCVAVLILLVTFRASEKLATAYGLAVTATLLLTTMLFAIYARSAWRWSAWKIATIVASFVVLEVMFFAANLTKVAHGGWLPLLIATIVALCMLTWRRGTTLVSNRRAKLEGPLSDLLEEIHEHSPTRVPGTAIFLHPNRSTAPLALRENTFFNHVLHEKVLIVSMTSLNVPYVPIEERVVETDDLGDPSDHVDHITLQFGFQDDQDVPTALRSAFERGLIAVDPDDATYFISRISIHKGPKRVLAGWRKRLFIAMAHNAANPTEYFRLPIARVVIMGAQVNL